MKLCSCLFAVTAVMLLAAGPASAAGKTVLCKADESPCSTANTYPAGTPFTITVNTDWNAETSFSLKGETLSVSCPVSILDLRTTELSGSPLAAKRELFAFERCTRTGSKESCTVGVTGANASFETSGGWGITRLGTASESVVLNVKCGSFSCIYSAGSIPFESKGGPSLETPVDVQNLVFTRLSGLKANCGSSITMNGHYMLTTDEAVYLEH